MLIDRRGSMHLSFIAQGLATYTPDGRWSYCNTENSSIPSDNVYDFSIGGDDSLWILTEKGLARCLDGGWDSFGSSDELEINPENNI